MIDGDNDDDIVTVIIDNDKILSLMRILFLKTTLKHSLVSEYCWFAHTGSIKLVQASSIVKNEFPRANVKYPVQSKACFCQGSLPLSLSLSLDSPFL